MAKGSGLWVVPPGPVVAVAARVGAVVDGLPASEAVAALLMVLVGFMNQEASEEEQGVIMQIPFGQFCRTVFQAASSTELPADQPVGASGGWFIPLPHSWLSPEGRSTRGPSGAEPVVLD